MIAEHSLDRRSHKTSMVVAASSAAAIIAGALSAFALWGKVGYYTIPQEDAYRKLHIASAHPDAATKDDLQQVVNSVGALTDRVSALTGRVDCIVQQWNLEDLRGLLASADTPTIVTDLERRVRQAQRAYEKSCT